jgi:hypothetical protein
MKRIIYITLLIGSCFSCKKSFLEIIPKGSMLATELKDYDLLMNSRLIYELPLGLPSQVMADDVCAEQDLFQRQTAITQKAFRYEADLYATGNDNAWDINMFCNNIYTCNKIINEVMSATGGTDADKRALRAEALAHRAFYNLMLINYYGKPYNAVTADADPGFPIITQAEISQQFSRASVQQVYDHIISDLTTAIPDLVRYPVIRTRMSSSAAKALLGKVYLYMGRYTDALTQLDAAFADLEGSSVMLYDYNSTFGPGGSFLPITLFGPRYPGNNASDYTETLLSKTVSAGVSGTGFGSDGLSLDSATDALFAASDLRLNLYSKNYIFGSTVPGGRRYKYAQTFVKIGVQLQDLYLMRAEVRARTNNLLGAVEDVEYLRIRRMPPADAFVPEAVAASQQALISFIIDERRREFACEGSRWFDMRRLSQDPLFATDSYVHRYYQTDGTVLTYPLTAPRLTLRIPPSVTRFNPGMTNNP